MSEAWKPLPLDKPLYANLHPDAVGGGFQTAVENGFINEQGGHSRFPGFSLFANLGGNGRVYLHDVGGDLIAATSLGAIYRIDRSGTATNVTGVPVAGGRRVVFAKTDRDELLMAAGAEIVRLRAAQTELLSRDAPLTTHVAWIDGFTVAIEVNSGRFYHSEAGEPDSWDPLDTFSADGSPDNINSLLVTPFRELLLGGAQSVEQFERLGGDAPFFRRWAIGDGVKLPYALIFADNAAWTVNALTEFVRLSGQTSQSASSSIGRLLEAIDDWSDAWIGGYPDRPLHTLGQKFIILQIPHATNAYGTKGVTLAYDYKNKRFFSLFGWDQGNAAPKRWPGWSHWTLWDRVFVGGEGKVYELTPNAYSHAGETQRWLVRTSHMSMDTDVMVNDFRLAVRRGVGSTTVQPSIRVRCSLDGRPFGPWISRSLGGPGDRLQFIEFGHFGSGSTFQWEISSTDDCAVDLMKAQVKLEALGH